MAALLMVVLMAPFVRADVSGQNMIIVPISEVGGSGVFGDATLIDNGDGTTTVDILVSGVTGDHPTTIRTGTCTNPRTVVYTLDPIASDGTSVSDIDAALGAFLDDGPWAVMIRRSTASAAPTIACGTVEVGGMPSQGSSAPTSQPSRPTATATSTPAPEPTTATTPTPAPTATATVDPALPTCQQFDAWVWAQTVFQEDVDRLAPSLDPDGNGIACEDLPMQGFAPALWTDSMPEGLTAVRVTGFYNGDTMQILANGQLDVLHLNGTTAPLGDQCGYGSAGSFLAFVLNLAPSLTLYVDYQNAVRDEQNRLVADVWYDYAGDPYLINEVIVRNGWAVSTPIDGMDGYADQIETAEAFAADHVLGAHFECGGVGAPFGSTPSAEQLEQARQRQPNQGQFAP
jgi:endonuclease YncB( thermonuclease family)